MTLADELMGTPVPSIARIRQARYIDLESAPLRLAFNGELSADERRMQDQAAFDGPASWEEN